MNTPLTKEFSYKVPVQDVWQALTEKDQMKIWYFPQLEEFEPKVGFKFQFNDNNSKYQKKWIVTKIVKDVTFAHSWSYKGYKGQAEVIFDLFSEGDSTKLKVTQTNLDTFPSDPHFARERFEWGWDNLLGQNLKDLLEKN